MSWYKKIEFQLLLKTKTCLSLLIFFSKNNALSSSFMYLFGWFFFFFLGKKKSTYILLFFLFKKISMIPSFMINLFVCLIFLKSNISYLSFFFSPYHTDLFFSFFGINIWFYLINHLLGKGHADLFFFWKQ